MNYRRLAYVTNIQAQHRFDELFEEMGIIPTFHDIDKIKSLAAFAARERTLPDFGYILIDLFDGMFSIEQVLSATQYIKAQTNAVPIFLAPKNENTTQLFGLLSSEFKIGTCVEDDGDKKSVIDGVRECISGERPGAFMGQLAAHLTENAKRLSVPFNVPDGLVVELAVAGSQKHIGATTQCFALYHYLKSKGFSPFLILDKKLLDCLNRMYEKKEEMDGYYRFGGIPAAAERKEGFNAFIFDLGGLSRGNIDLLVNADFPFIVGGSKPWEINALLERTEACGDKPLFIILSFSDEEECARLRKHTGKAVRCAEYYPNVFAPCENNEYLDGLIGKKLREYCGG